MNSARQSGGSVIVADRRTISPHAAQRGQDRALVTRLAEAAAAVALAEVAAAVALAEVAAAVALVIVPAST
jgi:hypothetical protein